MDSHVTPGERALGWLGALGASLRGGRYPLLHSHSRLRVHSAMAAILAVVCFLLCALGVEHVGAVALLPLGLALLALALVVPWAPWPARRA